MDWQILVVVAAVAGAGIYLVRRAIAMFRGNRGCGGCSGCGDDKSSAAQSMQPVRRQIYSLGEKQQHAGKR
jgi:hypothetical protein